jgi:hypothetical protein
VGTVAHTLIGDDESAFVVREAPDRVDEVREGDEP